MEKFKLGFTDRDEFERQDKSKLNALFGLLALSGFLSKEQNGENLSISLPLLKSLGSRTLRSCLFSRIKRFLSQNKSLVLAFPGNLRLF